MRPWLRPVPFALVFAFALAVGSHASIDDAAASREAALAALLANQGLVVLPEDIAWVDPPTGTLGAIAGRARAVFRGRERTDPSEGEGTTDIYLVDTRLSPEGSLLDVGDVFDLTRTSGADEGVPVVSGSLVAYVLSADKQAESVQVLDLAGHPPASYAEFSRLQRWQAAVTNWQATGSTHGFSKTVFAFTSPPARASVAFTPDGKLAIAMDDRTIPIDPKHLDPDADLGGLHASRDEVSKPPTFAPWMSERLRAVSWFGDDKNQALKAALFTARSWWQGVSTKVFGDTSAEDVAADMEALGDGKIEPATFTDPEIHWPPAPLTPMVSPKLAGEGQWIALEKDAFITPIPGLPSPFVTTFLRSDPAALQTRVYITLWDPRLIALHMVAGTVEPVSATGEAGPGRIPRKPQILRHLVAGFNGGFQATHGQYGMQADRVLYLPPKPYAATVMELDDGTTGFGAWPTNGGKTSGAVPSSVVSFRQNLTPLVQNDKYNPWGRTWWGGVPPGWHDAIHTTRSGICLTKENFVAYFWGNDISAEPLGKAMLAARCTFGMHLDMNPGLAGFEFYNVQPANGLPPLERPLQSDWEYQGVLKDVPDYAFRSRRMIKSMGHILFPRYIHRDGRDFFYLTTRTLLPGAPIPEDGGLHAEPWRVKGLPQHGYPYAIASTTVTLDPRHRARVLRVDPRLVRAATQGSQAADGSESSLVLAFGRRAEPKRPPSHDAGEPKTGGTGADRSSVLVLRDHAFVIAEAPSTDAIPLAHVSTSASKASDVRAAVGISDEDGMLQWIELSPESAADESSTQGMLSLLARMGCSQRGVVEGNRRVFLGGALDVAGEPAAMASVDARLVRSEAPGARTYFDTAVVPMAVWQPLQAQRVKWRPTLAPPEKPEAKPEAKPEGNSEAKPEVPPETNAAP